MNRPNRKRNRNKHRNPDPYELCERQLRGPVPLEICQRILTEPKNKLSRASRKRLLRSRESIVLATVSAPKPQPVKFAYWLERRSLVQINRQIRKCARRAATAKYILSDLSPGSLFRPAVQQEQDAQLHRLKQAVAERDSRIASK